MRRNYLAVLTLSLAMIFSACGEESSQQNDEMNQQVPPAGGAYEGEVPPDGADGNSKQNYISDVEEELNALDQEIEGIEQQVENSAGEDQQLREDWVELEENMEETRQNLDELRRTQDEDWEDMRDDINAQIKDLRNDLTDIRNRAGAEGGMINDNDGANQLQSKA